MSNPLQDKREEISAKTGFDSGRKFYTKDEVLMYFTPESQKEFFGDSAIQDKFELDKMANLVIENRWHCQFMRKLILDMYDDIECRDPLSESELARLRTALVFVERCASEKSLAHKFRCEGDQANARYYEENMARYHARLLEKVETL